MRVGLGPLKVRALPVKNCRGIGSFPDVLTLLPARSCIDLSDIDEGRAASHGTLCNVWLSAGNQFGDYTSLIRIFVSHVISALNSPAVHKISNRTIPRSILLRYPASLRNEADGLPSNGRHRMTQHGSEGFKPIVNVLALRLVSDRLSM